MKYQKQMMKERKCTLYIGWFHVDVITQKMLLKIQNLSWSVQQAVCFS